MLKKFETNIHIVHEFYTGHIIGLFSQFTAPNYLVPVEVDTSELNKNIQSSKKLQGLRSKDTLQVY